MKEDYKNTKFQDLNVIQKLQTTHEGTTNIYLAKLNDLLVVCKAIDKSAFKAAKSVQHVKNQKEILIHFTQSKHQNINHILGTFQDSDRIYMLLEPVQGLPIHRLLKMTEKFHLQFARLIVTQIAWIIKDFHKEGFIYRDIKSSNFMINQKGKVTMIDLGKAKRINRERTHTICGTKHAMPPEVLKNNGQGYGYQFDYYSFGILLYELLVGQAPFGYGNTNPELVDNILKGTSEQILNKIQEEDARALIGALLVPSEKRLGMKGGFQQILQHQFFDKQKVEIYRKIYQGNAEMIDEISSVEIYVSEIEDFGIDREKYSEIPEDDPFYKFCS